MLLKIVAVYQLLLMIFNKVGFNSKISLFFSNYLINKKTQYIWNNFVFSSFKADIEIGQGSVLSLILSTLYIVSIFYIFKKKTQNLFLNISISILSFFNDRYSISQKISYKKSNTNLFCSYITISFLFD